jgi:hypothetical protein
MPHTRCWTLTAALALALAAPAFAGTPRSKAKLVEKDYSVSDILDALDRGPAGADLIIRALTHTVQPKSWKGRGGVGTIHVHPADNTTLQVCHTPAVQRQVASVLKALKTVCAAKPAAAPAVMPAACDSSPEPAPLPGPAAGRSKQYTHFVLDNVRVKAEGVDCTIKRVRFMYKGDGIDADVAKCALTNGESEKKADVPKVLTELLEKLSEGGAAKPKEGNEKPVPVTCAISSIHVPPPSDLASSPCPYCFQSPTSECKTRKAWAKPCGESGAKVEKCKAKPE